MKQATNLSRLPDLFAQTMLHNVRFSLLILQALQNKAKWKPFNAAEPWNKLMSATEFTDDGYGYHVVENSTGKNNLVLTFKLECKNIRVGK